MSHKLTYPTPYIAIAVLLLCMLSCVTSATLSPIQPTQTTVVPTYEIVKVTGNVYIRNQAGEITSLVAEKGMWLVGNIDGDVFRLLSGETVFIGCTDISERGCQSK